MNGFEVTIAVLEPHHLLNISDFSHVHISLLGRISGKKQTKQVKEISSDSGMSMSGLQCAERVQKERLSTRVNQVFLSKERYGHLAVYTGSM